MSQAIHIGTNHADMHEWFECPQCGARQMVSRMVWHEVPVIGEKPTLNICEHQPHIPPSPASFEAHERSRTLLGVAMIAAGEIERGKAILDPPASPRTQVEREDTR